MPSLFPNLLPAQRGGSSRSRSVARLPHRDRGACVVLALVAALLAGCVAPPRAWHDERDVWGRDAGMFADDESAPGDGPTAPGPDADLDALIAWALHVSPELRAAAQRWRSALERVPQVGGLPDPTISFTYYLDEVQSRDGPLDWRAGFTQPLPWFGELDLADEAALADARSAGARFEQARLDLVARLRDAWAELAWADAAVLATSGHRDLLQRWEGVARTRYANGLGDESDLIRAQVELGQLEDRLRSLEDLRRPLAARINAALDRPVATPLATPGFSSSRDAPVDESALRAAAARSAPRLSALDHAVDAASARVALADVGFYPRPSVGLDYTRVGGGDDAVGLTAGISLPIWRGRVRAAVSGAEAEHAAARSERRAASNRVAEDLERELYRLRDAARRVALYRDSLLPKGRESLDAVDQSYRAGRADFLELVDAQRVLLEFELALARARADHDQSRAALIALTGVDLDADTEEESP